MGLGGQAADPNSPLGTDGAASRIREARRALGLTQDELARRVGVSRSAIAQWETDRTGQVRANLARVAAVLGVSIGYLVSGESEAGLINVETPDERALLSLYRQIREPGRSELLRNARRMAVVQGLSPIVTD
ncbi:helix-turn-helix domain-containing protein [Acidisoma sp.]|uniref:helix-turn-helix domain-containing protein n=1 Tax=Acidisoma sp. TaxID=1872115 RepID=UPI003AFF9716